MAARSKREGWVTRVDRGTLHVAHRRPDGTLLAEGFAARAGIAEYRIGGKIVRELVRPETLRRAAHGLARQVVTLDHPDPDEYPDMVTPENVDALMVGDTDSEVTIHDGGYTRVRLAVRRKDALDAIDEGTSELSAGYHARIDGRPGADPAYAYPGNPEGRWDQEQVERAYNHLAIVDRARWGSDIHLRADSGVAANVIDAPVRADHTSNQRARAPRAGGTVNPVLLQMLIDLNIRTDGITTDEAAISVAGPAVRQLASARTDGDRTHRAALDSMTAERDAAIARATTAEGKVKALEDAERARADADDRKRLDGIAVEMGIDPKVHATLDAISNAIAAKVLGGAVPAGSSPEYVRGAVQVAEAQIKARKANRGDGREFAAAVWDGIDDPDRLDNDDPDTDPDLDDPPARRDGNRPKRRPTANEQRIAQIEAARKAREGRA